MRYEIYRVDIWPVVRVAFFLSALLGFLIGLVGSMMLYLFSGLVRTILPYEVAGPTGPWVAPLMVLMSLGWAPIYGSVGAMLAATGVLLYNWITHWIGGITVHLKDVEVPRTESPHTDPFSDV